MTFAIPGAAYDRFMGRYSVELAPLFADFVGVEPRMHVLDVGCGPGALATELARRVGAANVAGIDPSASFVEACRARLPDADIQSGPAERLLWGDGTFDAALSQLVLSFVSEADQVAHEMRRVVRERGTVGACMWLEGASLQMGQLFWESAATVDPAITRRESNMPYRKPGEIANLWKRTGLRDVEETFLEVRASYQNFDDFWEPIVSGAGSIGTYMASADEDRRAAIREACRVRMGNPAPARPRRAGVFDWGRGITKTRIRGPQHGYRNIVDRPLSSRSSWTVPLARVAP
jgi:ubiquinone/menaquinone biosynthesis C-methylase UbiE